MISAVRLKATNGPTSLKAALGNRSLVKSLREVDRSMQQDRHEDASSCVVEDPGDDDREADRGEKEHADT
jgi:hypothetical protein